MGARNPRLLAALLASGLAAATTTTATAQVLINTTSDTRTVTANAIEGSFSNPIQQVSETIVSPGTSLFQETASAAVTGTPGFADCFASIDSEILDTRLTVVGSSAGNGSIDGSCCADAVVFGAIEFDVPEPCHYRFHGFVEGYDGGFGEAYFSESGGATLGGLIGIAAGVVPFDASGTIPAGSYVVSFRANGGFCSPNSFASSNLDFALDLTPVATRYCASTVNSSGNAAAMGLSGSPSVSANDLVLEASGGPPGQLSLFLYAPNEGTLPLGNGTLCVGPPFQRLGDPMFIDAMGGASLALDLAASPLNVWMGGIAPGSTWRFQWIFRDSVGAGLDFSDGLRVSFFP